MGVTAHIATFLLLVSTALLTATCFTSPYVNSFGFLTIKSSSETYHFGVWGYCQTGGDDKCSPRTIGYALAQVVTDLTKADNIPSGLDTMTKSLILHPVAAGLSWLALFIATLSNKCGFLLASVSAGAALLFSLIVMVVDWALFATAGAKAIDAGLQATWGYAIYMVTIAMVVLGLAVVFTLAQCCCGRSKRDEYAPVQKY